MNDLDRGHQVLRAFWMSNRSYYPSFKLTYQEFLDKVIPPNKQSIIIDGIGMGVRSAEISDSDISKAMRDLAAESKGRLPSDYQVFFKYLSKQAVKINWVDAVVYTAKESVVQVADAAVSVGESIITTGKIVNWFLPAILIFFLLIWMNNSSGGGLTKIYREFKK